eukprot:CAMPEP_0173433236 /NCGR_PEP_ID=MMETSP1357-20121228/10759_1 /TAXON_ID=77926 /ORGANISM="Hemiselmis rufescens, Strain PCC563" /LENGTH=335 /DNA_ID=CAMNT_0014397923 /DNA_START=71 /DNA_END=1076 /DNA_ORIENTATION=+
MAHSSTATSLRLPGNLYLAVGWAVFWVTLLLCVLDRWYGRNGDTAAGADRAGQDAKHQSNMGEWVTTIVWALTARVMIPGQNMLFYSVMWVFPNELARFFPTLDLRKRHIRVHRFVAQYLLLLPLFVHLAAAAIPVIMRSHKLVLHPLKLNWSKPWDPVVAVGFKSWITATQVNFSPDDVFRLVASFLCIFVLLPASLQAGCFKRLRASFSVRSILHASAALWITFDMVRKTTHRLSHLFNLPMLTLWAIDRFASVFLYLRRDASSVSVVPLDDSHCAVYLKFPTPVVGTAAKPASNPPSLGLASTCSTPTPYRPFPSSDTRIPSAPTPSPPSAP